MQPLSEATIAALQAAEAGVMLASARAQAVGGDAWTVTRTTGDGIAAPRVETELDAPIAGSVYRAKPKAVVVNGALFQPDDAWRLVAAAGTSVQVGDRLTSVSDTSLVFQVMSLETRAGYVVAILEVTA